MLSMSMLIKGDTGSLDCSSHEAFASSILDLKVQRLQVLRMDPHHQAITLRGSGLGLRNSEFSVQGFTLLLNESTLK